MIERSLQLDTSGTNTNGTRCATRPTDLPTENRRWTRHGIYTIATNISMHYRSPFVICKSVECVRAFDYVFI